MERASSFANESPEERRVRFERTTAPHLDALYRVALRMTGAPDRAEDAVQETYLRAWKYWRSFTEGRDARVWLFAILRNAIFEGARKRRREVRASSLDEVGLDAIPGPAPEPVERLKEQDVLRAVEELPAQIRVVALLAIVEDFAYREVAAALEIPVGTVMSRLFRARQLLRDRLREAVAGEPVKNEVRP